MRLFGNYCDLIVTILASAPASTQTQQDIKGSSDHPLLPNRMPGYTIVNYEKKGYDSFNFDTDPKQPIEGKYT